MRRIGAVMFRPENLLLKSGGLEVAGSNPVAPTKLSNENGALAGAVFVAS